MTDPRDFDRRTDLDLRGMDMDRMGSATPYWIAGAVFIIVLLALVFTSSEGDRTAREGTSPPATTGMAPRTAPPAIAVPPAETPSTTGQGGQRGQ